MATTSQTRPRKSTSLVTIAFGPDRKCYQISRNCLLDLTWLRPNQDRYETSLDEETGKIVLHYLSTGIYESPWTEFDGPTRVRVWLDIRTAIQVLFVAEIWLIPKLRRIVRAKIETLSDQVSICDLVELVDEELSEPDLPNITHSRKWLYNHLSNALENAIKEDSREIDELIEFIDFKDIELYKELTKNMIRFLDKRVHRARK